LHDLEVPVINSSEISNIQTALSPEFIEDFPPLVTNIPWVPNAPIEAWPFYDMDKQERPPEYHNVMNLIDILPNIIVQSDQILIHSQPDQNNNLPSFLPDQLINHPQPDQNFEPYRPHDQSLINFLPDQFIQPPLSSQPNHLLQPSLSSVPNHLLQLPHKLHELSLFHQITCDVSLPPVYNSYTPYNIYHTYPPFIEEIMLATYPKVLSKQTLEILHREYVDLEVLNIIKNTGRWFYLLYHEARLPLGDVLNLGLVMGVNFYS
jgi:hypothetical protein